MPSKGIRGSRYLTKQGAVSKGLGDIGGKITYTIYNASGQAIATIDPHPNCAVQYAPNGSWDIGADCTVNRTYYDDLGRAKTEVRNLDGPLYTSETPPNREAHRGENTDKNIRTDYSYDPSGNRIETTDPNGIITHFDYDALGDLTDVYENYIDDQLNTATVDINVHTQYTYDERGNRITIRSANTFLPPVCVYPTVCVTSFSYDKLNRLTAERDPLNHGMDYGYNVLGERTSQTDALGAQTNFIYDALGRLITIDYPDGDANIDAHFGYGPTDLRLTMTDGGGTSSTTWNYNALGQVERVTDPSQNVVQYGYDGLGNRTWLIYPDQKTVAYGYDKLNRLKTVTDWNNQATSYTYLSTQTGFTRQVQRSNGVVSTDTLDAVGRLVDRAHAHGDTTLASYHYEYEPVGNRWQATEQALDPHQTYLPVILNEDSGGEQGLLSGQPETGETIDGTGDIETGEAYPAPSEGEPLPMEEGTPEEDAYPVPETTTQSPSLLDALVDFLTWLVSPQDTVQAAGSYQGYPPPGGPPPENPPANGPIITTYTYDPLHRLTGAADDHGNTYAYAYDANGNRVSEQVSGGSPVISVYDQANRLTSVDGVTYTWDDNGNLTNDGTHKYVYDRANRLKTVTDLNNNPLATYTYNGLGDRLTENDTEFILDQNAGLTQVLQDGTYTYLYGSERIMQQSQTSTGYFLGDALSSVRQLVDENGSVTLTKSYEPYGELASSSGLSATTAYGYTGEWYSSSTNLLYLRARFYNPTMGRFLIRDIWQGDYNMPRSYNSWLYGYSNPVKFVDRSGYCPSGPSGESCREFAVKISKLYGVHFDYGNKAPYHLGNDCSEGYDNYYWTLDELRTVADSLNILRLFLNDTLLPYKSYIGNEKIIFKRIVINSQGEQNAVTYPLPNNSVPPYSNLLNITGIVIELDNGVFSPGISEAGKVSTVLHELFHAFEWNFRGSGFTRATNGMISQQEPWSNLTPGQDGLCGPTTYACSKIDENFAEAAVVYSMDLLLGKGIQFAGEVIKDKAFIKDNPKSQPNPRMWSDNGERYRALKKLFFGR